MKKAEIIKRLIEKRLLNKEPNPKYNLFFLSVYGNNVLLDMGAMEEGVIYLVSQTPSWYLTSGAVRLKEILAFVATNDTNRRMLLEDNQPKFGSWEFDLSKDDDDRIVAKFMFISKIPAFLDADSIVAIIEYSISTLLKTKDQLEVFARKNYRKITVDDAIPTDNYKIRIDFNALHSIMKCQNDDSYLNELHLLGCDDPECDDQDLL